MKHDEGVVSVPDPGCGCPAPCRMATVDGPGSDPWAAPLGLGGRGSHGFPDPPLHHKQGPKVHRPVSRMKPGDGRVRPGQWPAAQTPTDHCCSRHRARADKSPGLPAWSRSALQPPGALTNTAAQDKWSARTATGLRAQLPSVACPRQELCSRAFHFPEGSLRSPHPEAPWDLLLRWLPQRHSWASTRPVSPGSFLRPWQRPQTKRKRSLGPATSSSLSGAWTATSMPELRQVPRRPAESALGSCLRVGVGRVEGMSGLQGAQDAGEGPGAVGSGRPL